MVYVAEDLQLNLEMYNNIIIIIIYSYSKNLKTNSTIKIYIYDKVVD